MGIHGKRDWERLFKISDSYFNEWIRKVEFNNELQIKMSIIRQRFGFPLINLDEAIQWLSNNPSKSSELSDLTNNLVEEFQINEEWGTSIFYLIIIEEPLGRKIPMGLPGGTFRVNEGEIYHEVNLTSDVDISNPIVQKIIKFWQQRDDPLPMPLPEEGNYKKLNWFPVWVWHMRHPGVSLKEIAEELKLSYGYVRRKIAEINKEVESNW